MTERTCRRCNGTGQDRRDPDLDCDACGGDGTIEEQGYWRVELPGWKTLPGFAPRVTSLPILG